MNICPACNKDIGVLTGFEWEECSHCQASLEVQDGQLVLLKEQEITNSSDLAEPSEELQEASEEVSSNQFEVQEFTDVSSYPAEASIRPVDLQKSSSEEIDPVEESPFEEGYSSDKAESDDDEFNSEDEVGSMEHLIESADEDLPRYKVRILGVDSSELKLQVKQALSHSRLDIPKEAITHRPDKGLIIISNLDSVKTVFLVRKISHIPVQVTWAQKSKLESTQ